MIFRELTYPQKIEGEHEDHYSLFLHYLDSPEIQTLSKMSLYGLTEGEIYSIGVKNKWAERIKNGMVQESEAKNNDLKRRLHVAYQNNLENYVTIYESTQHRMHQFHLNFTADVEIIGKYQGMDEETQLKRIAHYNKIDRDFIFIINKLETYLEKAGLGRDEVNKCDFKIDFEEALEANEVNKRVRIDVDDIPDADELRQLFQEEEEEEKRRNEEINLKNNIEKSKKNMSLINEENKNENVNGEELIEPDESDTDEDIEALIRMGYPFKRRSVG